MKAAARVVVRADRIEELRSDPPLTLRSTRQAVYLIGSAAGPIGGDELSLEIDVRGGAELTVRSAAASIVQPGPGGAASRFTITATVGAGAMLRWLPEPSIATGGCRHVADVRLFVDPTATVTWRDELILGREGERCGSWESRLLLESGGFVVLRQTQRFGPDGWDGPAVVGDAKAIGSLTLVGGELPEMSALPSVALMRVGPRAALVSAVALDATALRDGLSSALPRTGIPSPAR